MPPKLKRYYMESKLEKIEEEEVLKFYREVYAIHIRSAIKYQQLSADNLTLSDPEDIKVLTERRSEAKVIEDTTKTTLNVIREHLGIELN